MYSVRGEILRLKLICLVTLIFFGLVNIVQAAEKNQMNAIRWAMQPNSPSGAKVLRIVIDVDAPTKPTYTYDEKQKVLIIEAKDLSIGKYTGVLPIKSDVIKSVVGKKVSDTSSQILIYFNKSMTNDTYKVFGLAKDLANKKPDRVVIDIVEIMPLTAVNPTNLTPSLKDKIIVIDPGHGGSDPGAIGLGKTREKDATLVISLKLRDLLVKKGAKVFMTRIKDNDVHSASSTDAQELQARVDVGVKYKADVFVSIHHNASANRDVGGISTYYFAKTKYDGMLADSVQKNMIKSFALDDLGIRQAGFYVTKRSPMPAVLLEIAFISNPKEERLLKSNWFCSKMATSIANGLEDYFNSAAGGKK